MKKEIIELWWKIILKKTFFGKFEKFILLKVTGSSSTRSSIKTHRSWCICQFRCVKDINTPKRCNYLLKFDRRAFQTIYVKECAVCRQIPTASFVSVLLGCSFQSFAGWWRGIEGWSHFLNITWYFVHAILWWLYPVMAYSGLKALYADHMLTQLLGTLFQDTIS